MRPVSFAAVAEGFGDGIERCHERIERVVSHARARGASLVVLPECALGGYLTSDGRPGEAVEPDGPEIRRLVELAGPTVVCLGYTERGPGRPYSSAVCLSGAGVHGHQRKVHLPPSEVGALSAGDGFAAFDSPVGRLGMLLCYDKVFPEAARTLALDGAETIASLSAWSVSRSAPARRAAADRQTRQFNLLDQARALENQVVWVSSNLHGRIHGLRYPGQAKVVDPEGNVLAATGARRGMALAWLHPAFAVERARAPLSHLGDRVAGSYGLSERLPLASPAGALA